MTVQELGQRLPRDAQAFFRRFFLLLVQFSVAGRWWEPAEPGVFRPKEC